MKKCIVKVVNYLRNEKQVLIVDKDPSGEIGVKYLMNDEKNDFVRDRVLPLFLYNFLTQQQNAILITTNMFKRFSEYFNTIDYDEEIVTDFMLELVEQYSQLQDNPDKKDDLNYIDFFDTYFIKENKKISPLCFYSLLNMDGNPFFMAIENNKDITDFVLFDLDSIVNNCREIREKRISKSERLSSDDINDIAVTLFLSGVSLKISNIVYKTLIKRNVMLAQDNCKADEHKDVSRNANNFNKSSKYISDKDYKHILKEIKKYYNPNTGELVMNGITNEQREYIASLMIHIDLEQYQIIDFLNKTSLTDKTYTYEYFKNHTAEFEFYYKDFLDTINEYLEEIKKSNTAEDKNFWITGINEELKNLPLDGKLYSYEYEIELIKRKGYKNEEEN